MDKSIIQKAFANPQNYRNQLLQQNISPKAKDYPGKTFICVSLTRFCPVGCKFCFFKSAPVYKKPSIEDAFDKDNLYNFINFANNINLGYLLVSGGGEPMIQRDAVLEIIEKVECERIVLVTSANWAKTAKQTKSYVEDIAAAISRRSTPTLVTIRVSCDLDHNSNLGYEPIYNLIRLFEQEYREHKQLELKLHSVADDPSIDLVIKELSTDYTIERKTNINTRISDGKSVIKIVPKQEVLTFNGYAVPVGYAKIFFSNLKVNLHEDIAKNLAVYQQDIIESEDGNSSVVSNVNGDEGLDFWINYNGNVTTWGNQFLDNLFNVHEDSPQEVIEKSLGDVAALAFIEKGADYRDRVVNEVNPTAVIRSKAVNIRDYTGALMFDEARTRLYFMLRVIQDYISEGRITADQIASLPEDLHALINTSNQELRTAYHNAEYTVVEQIMKQPFNKKIVQDMLEWLHLGHYQISSAKIHQLLGYYNEHVSAAERVTDIAALKVDLSYQNARMTEYLTHIKPSLKPANSVSFEDFKPRKRTLQTKITADIDA